MLLILKLIFIYIILLNNINFQYNMYSMDTLKQDTEGVDNDWGFYIDTDMDCDVYSKNKNYSVPQNNTKIRERKSATTASKYKCNTPLYNEYEYDTHNKYINYNEYIHYNEFSREICDIEYGYDYYSTNPYKVDNTATKMQHGYNVVSIIKVSSTTIITAALTYIVFCIL